MLPDLTGTNPLHRRAASPARPLTHVPMLLLTLIGALSLPALAQTAEPKPAQPPPDLDSLLGIPKKKPAEPPPPAELPAEPAPEPRQPDDLDKAELERKLTAQEMAQKFDVAVRQMGESADRMERARDVGIATQRLHEEILRNLDVLIKQSKQGGSSSSSSSSSSQQDSEAARAAQQRGQQQGNRNQQAGSGENRGEAMPPAMTPAERQARLDTARAAWGNLPQRIRDSLLEGSSDYFSALYESMTEAYYKKIAEEAKE